MKNLLVLTLCTFCSLFLNSVTHAQSSEASVAEKELDRNTFLNPFSYSHQNHFNSKLYASKVEMEKLFVLNEWSPMEAFGVDGNNLKVDSANYLIGQRKILFKKDGEMFQVFPTTVNEVMIGEKLFKPYKDINDEGLKVNLFYEVVATGQIDLIRKWSTKEQRVSNNPMGISETNDISISRISKLFYCDNTKKRKKVVKMPRKKSEVFDIFGSKKQEVMKYANKHKLSVKKEAGLSALFLYYNSLK